MPRIFSFTDRTTASNGPPSLLADGAFYERHKSRFDLSGAENVRFNVLLGRLGKAEELEDPELARDCLEKLTMLVFQRVSCPPVKPLDNEALYAHLERFFQSDRESQEERPQSRDRAEEPDIGLAVCQYADRYKQDPFYVWEQVPLWMLDAGLGAMKLLQLPESVRRSQEVQMGTGSFKSKAQMRSVAREWQKQAMGRQLAPQTAKGFLAQGLGMGIPASQTVITDPEKAKAFTASVLALREREAELLRGK